MTTKARRWGERELVRVEPLVAKVHHAGKQALLDYLIELIGDDHVLAVDAEELLHRHARRGGGRHE